MSYGEVDKKELLKRLIRRLHEGAKVEDVKEEFKNIVKDASPTLISQAEEELIREGMPREEIRKLCDVHIAVFRESLEREKAIAPLGHPVHTLMEEHKLMLKFAADLHNLSKKIEEKSGFSEAPKEEEQLNHLIKHLKESESHYLREENVLFPYLEKHKVTQPPAIMWTEHDRIREIKKDLFSRIENHRTIAFEDFVKQLQEDSLTLSETLSNHFYKENNILFPTSLKVIEAHEWKHIRKQFDEIGYCCFTPESAPLRPEEAEIKPLQHESEGVISFETGSFSKEELELLLNNLPVDITFIGKDDTVRYFSQGKERIFVRTKAIIGRKVQQCHPEKSVHKVNQILESFKNGSKDVAEFWINLQGRLIYIRYFPVRKENGEYLGCLEVTQNITEIKKIEGDKRLLDWE
jgi:PAS domain S-box-containing protein